MLGMYESFPQNVQKAVSYSFSVSCKKLQHAITETLHRLNTETLRLEDLGSISIPKCKVIFELGIAETQIFSYLDDEETMRVLDKIQEKPFRVMDFLCAVRYYRAQNGKTTPLRFDYYMLRFVFEKGWVDLRIFHERGSMHVAPSELAGFLSGRVNCMFSRKVLKAVETS